MSTKARLGALFEMNLMMLILVSVLVSLGCGSKVQTRKKIEASEGKEETTGREGGTKYRSLEGSPGQSAEEAGAQLAGD